VSALALIKCCLVAQRFEKLFYKKYFFHVFKSFLASLCPHFVKRFILVELHILLQRSHDWKWCHTKIWNINLLDRFSNVLYISNLQ